jgi:hypothetical protein
MQHATIHAADHSEREVDAQNERRDLHMLDGNVAPAVDPRDGRRESSGQQEDNDAGHEVHGDNGADDGVHGVHVAARPVMRHVPADRRAESQIQDARIAGQRIDEHPDAVAFIPDPLEHEWHEEEADQQRHDVRRPTGDDARAKGHGEGGGGGGDRFSVVGSAVLFPAGCCESSRVSGGNEGDQSLRYRGTDAGSGRVLRRSARSWSMSETGMNVVASRTAVRSDGRPCMDFCRHCRAPIRSRCSK